MNLAQFRAQVTLQLGNPPAAHPIMALLDSWINDAIRDLPQQTLPGSFDRRTLFPELTRQAMFQPAANQAWVEVPKNMLAPLEMFCYWSETEPDLDFARANPVSYIDWEQYQVQSKASSTSNWAQLYSWFDTRFYLWPTPISGFLGWMTIFYLFEQPPLTDPTHVPVINERWNRAICHLATSYGEAAQNHKERAAFFEGEASKQIVKAMNWVGMHDQRKPWNVIVSGDASSEETYG